MTYALSTATSTSAVRADAFHSAYVTAVLAKAGLPTETLGAAHTSSPAGGGATSSCPPDHGAVS